MIRVTFLAHSLRVGGTEVQFSALIRGLDRDRFTSSVVSFHNDGALIDEIRASGVQVYTAGMGNRRNLIGALRNIARAVRSTRPDVVYSFLDFPNAVAALTMPMGHPWKLIWGIRASDMRLKERGLTW